MAENTAHASTAIIRADRLLSWCHIDSLTQVSTPMKTSPATRRVAFTLPAPLVASLGYVALRLGVSKSDLLTSLIEAPVVELRGILFQYAPPLDALPGGDQAALLGDLGRMLQGHLAQARGLAAVIDGDASGVRDNG